MTALLRRLLMPLTAAMLATTMLTAPTTASAQLMIGQSFTAPIGPNLFLQSLSLAGVAGSAAEPFTAQIFALDGFSLSGGNIFSQALSANFSGFALAPNLVLAAGGRYAVLVVSPASGYSGFSTFYDLDVYAGGEAIICNALSSACSAVTSIGQDVRGFSLEFGAVPTVTPEPASLLLVGTGLVGLLAMGRKRQRSA